MSTSPVFSPSHQTLVIAHRGNLDGPQSKGRENTLSVLLGAVAAGFGVETDFRADGERLTLSHDVAPWEENRDALTLLRALNALSTDAAQPRLHAFNIKDRGGLILLLSALRQLPALAETCFLFDFELTFGPQEAQALMVQAAQVVRIAWRASDREPVLEALLHARKHLLWLDEFDEVYSTPIRLEHVRSHAASAVCVSPDLHGATDFRVITERWSNWRAAAAAAICTDYSRSLAQHLRES